MIFFFLGGGGGGGVALGRLSFGGKIKSTKRGSTLTIVNVTLETSEAGWKEEV